MKKIAFTDLHKYTPWLKKLDGGAIQQINAKNTHEILREYDIDKWGNLLTKIKGELTQNINRADEIFMGTSESAFYYRENLFLEKIQEIHKLHYEIVLQNLICEIESPKLICELGAGYGTLILKLAGHPHFDGCTFLGADLTKSGLELLNFLSNTGGYKNIMTAQCDLNELDFNGYPNLRDSIIFTSYSLACIKGFPLKSIESLVKCNPKVVIHFEPIYEFFNVNESLGKYWKKYTEINDYNTSMMSDLINYHNKGFIEILEQVPNVFGHNPFFPLSIVKWRPKKLKRSEK